LAEAGAGGFRAPCDSQAHDGDPQADADTRAADRAAGANLMIFIVLIAVTAIVLLQSSGAIPQSSVGGPIAIALVVFLATLAVGIHEAWSNRRGVLGWIVNIVVVLVGAFVIGPVAGMVMVLVVALLNPGGGSSLAAMGGPLLDLALAGHMILTLLGSWAALQVVNRWR